MLIKIKQDNMPNPNKKIGPRPPKSRMGKRGLMQMDPMTGMPVAQPGSTPMFPVSNGFVGGSTAKFNPMINQYAQANPLANAAYASQPMPALAQQYGQKAVGTLVGDFPPRMRMQKVIQPLQPDTGYKEIKSLPPTMSMTKEVKPLPPTAGTKVITPRPTMKMEKVIKPLEEVPTISYGQMAIGRKALKQEKDAAQVITEDIGPAIISGAANLITGVPVAKAAIELGTKASNVLSNIRKGAKKHFEEKDPALNQKPIPEGSGLEDLAKSGAKGKAAVEKMGYETNALAKMKSNGMYKKNCGYKK